MKSIFQKIKDNEQSNNIKDSNKQLNDYSKKRQAAKNGNLKNAFDDGSDDEIDEKPIKKVQYIKEEHKDDEKHKRKAPYKVNGHHDAKKPHKNYMNGGGKNESRSDD